jgi:prepilin signal peptidase PulO-like enzyme (type II secretory pathway)
MEFIVFIAGIFLGSFLGALGWRLPKGKPVAWDRSRCEYCGHTLSWRELIPVVSFLWQGARCAHCRRQLSWLYPASELVTGVGFVLLFRASGGFSPLFVVESIVFGAFVVLFVADTLYQILPDAPLLVALFGILGLFFLTPPSAWQVHIASAAGAGAFFAFLHFFTRGAGMGFGDVKLAAVLGFLLGYPGIIIALYAAFLTGAIVGVILMVRRKLKLKSRIAFGPFLLLGAAIAILWSNEILTWWSGFFV